MTYEELLQGLCVHVIPMANPDGVTISQYGPKGIHDKECRQILKQCREADGADGRDYWKNWKANARGVDLNRNFDVGWQEFQGSLRPSSERYKGDVPASETETQAILSIPQRYPVVGCMAYHSSGNLVYWDYGSGVRCIWKTRNWHRQSVRLQDMRLILRCQMEQIVQGAVLFCIKIRDCGNHSGEWDRRLSAGFRRISSYYGKE